MNKVLVCGAGGFIGGHLVADLRRQGVKDIRAVDHKPFEQWYQRFDDVESLRLDLQEKDACETAVKGCDWIYNLAADMGGMGFIELNKGLCMLSVLINTHMLTAARKFGGVGRFFYASSACVYNGSKQTVRTLPRSPRRTPIRRCPRTATAGRSFSASACAAISARISA